MEVIVTEEEFKVALATMNEETEEETLKRVLMTNVELFERLLELHEFLEENDLTQSDFQKWKKEKYERNYH
jgi:hypothetical protein|tara:strand:+ start:824 stop:1036 length:213 start_codon:yes stop_codon:yes gene_type:complete